MCESTGSAAQRTVAVLLPTLLEKGIISNVAEVRSLRYHKVCPKVKYNLWVYLYRSNKWSKSLLVYSFHVVL